MPFKFNPFTGNLDIVGTGGSSTPQSVITKTLVAQETISALKVVRSGVYIASPTGTYEDARLLGIALTAATAGNNIEVLEFGEASDASFTFAAGVPLFLGVTGNITDVAPSSGFSVKIGYALGSNKIQVDPMVPIQL